MVIGFNADEVFEMAIRIEENGAAFYRKAAGLQSDAENREFLKKLAAMEDSHKATFIEIRKTLTDKEKSGKVFDPQDELSLYLAAMADTHGGEGSPSAADSLTGTETMEELLTTAIINDRYFPGCRLTPLSDPISNILGTRCSFHHDSLPRVVPEYKKPTWAYQKIPGSTCSPNTSLKTSAISPIVA